MATLAKRQKLCLNHNKNQARTSGEKTKGDQASSRKRKGKGQGDLHKSDFLPGQTTKFANRVKDPKRGRWKERD